MYSRKDYSPIRFATGFYSSGASSSSITIGFYKLDVENIFFFKALLSKLLFNKNKISI